MSATAHSKTDSACSVLVIEDELLDAHQLVEYIDDHRVRFERVTGVEEALHFFETGQAADVVMVSSDAAQGRNVAFIRMAIPDSTYLIVVDAGHASDGNLYENLASGEINCVLSKPFDSRNLKAKLLYGANYSNKFRQQAEQRKILFEHWQHMDIEQEIAAKIYNNVLQSQFFQTKSVQFLMSPMALFNGDLLLVEKTPDNHLHVLLGDFTGHGLSASIAATPVADIFYGMTRKGFQLREILQEINEKLVRMLPANIFLAATAMALFPDSKVLNVIACGLPDHFLVDHSTGQCLAVKSVNLPLGIISGIELIGQNFQVVKTHHFYCMTDGIIEVANRKGEMFGVERVVEAILSGEAETNLETLKAAALSFSDGLSQSDDLSLMKLDCDVDHCSWGRPANDALQAKMKPPLTWKNSFVFDIDVLRDMNPVPLMVNGLMEIQGLMSHRQSIYMIVTELFANALDHGILRIDSSIKQNPESFMRFYQIKEKRLADADFGFIRFSFTHRPIPDGGRLTIKVVDSGQGFDFKARDQSLKGNTGFSGRGINLIESLCSQLVYHGNGNRATAVFEWRRN